MKTGRSGRISNIAGILLAILLSLAFMALASFTGVARSVGRAAAAGGIMNPR